MRYTIYVNGLQKYKQTFTARKANEKAEYLRARGFKSVEIIEEAAGRNKYNAIKTEMFGEKFDSQAEAGYYCELLDMQKRGVVSEIQLKPRYSLVPPYHHPTTGKFVRGVNYIADFFVVYADGTSEVIDVKSRVTRTAVYRVKKKLFEFKYGVPLTEVMR